MTQRRPADLERLREGTFRTGVWVPRGRITIAAGLFILAAGVGLGAVRGTARPAAHGLPVRDAGTSSAADEHPAAPPPAQLQPGGLLRFRHNDDVQRVAISPNGTLLASALEFGVAGTRPIPAGAVIWDLTTGRRRAVFKGPASRTRRPGPVWDVDFSPDGEKLATANAEGTVFVWDLATGTLERDFKAVRGYITEFVSFATRDRLLTGQRSGGVGMWDIPTAKRVATFRGVHFPSSLQCSPEGSLVAVGSGTTVVGRNLPRVGELIPEPELPPSGMEKRAIGQLQVSDARTGKRRWGRVGGRPEFIWRLAFSRDGALLASAGETLRLWNAATGALLWTRLVRSARPGDEAFVDGHVLAVVFSRDGKRLASLSFEPGAAPRPRPGWLTARLMLWNVADGALLAQSSDLGDEWETVAFAADGSVVAAGSDGTSALARRRTLPPAETHR